MSSSPTLYRTQPLTRNLRTLADEENAGDWTERDSDATSSTGGDAETKKKQRRLEQSAWRRARAIAKAGEDPTLANLSFIERESVSLETEGKYKKQVEQFLNFADEENLALVADDEVDAAIVLYLNMSYSQGRLVSDGEVLLAGLLFFQPQHGKLGGQKLARRALKGWRKRAPTRSRRPLPRMIWSGVCWEKVRNKKPLMAIHILMMIETCCRPGELLQSMRKDLIRPMHGVASDWSLLLHPVQRGVPSKTQSFDDTIDLKNQIYPWITKVAAVLAAGRPSEKIFEYRFEDSPRSFEGQHEHFD